jgi:DNA-binding response OmpR family regulator
MVKRCEMCGQVLAAPSGIRFDPDSGVLIRQYFARMLALRRGDSAIMAVMLEKPERVKTDTAMWDALYGQRPDADQPESLSTIASRIHHLNKELRTIALVIRRVRGVGYHLRDLRTVKKAKC